jgi:alpha-1,2-mannosyltransferase
MAAFPADPMELLQTLRGSGLLANPAYYTALVCGLFALWLLFKRGVSERAIWTAAIGLSVLIAIFVFMFSVPPSPFQDFTRAYWGAGRGVHSGWEGLSQHYGREVFGFVNLPILAYLFAPFALLEPQPAAYIFTALGFGAVIFTWWKICALYNFDLRTRVFSLFLIAAFGPLVYSFREANTTHILLLPLVLAVSAMRNKQDLRAGALIATAALIKPFLLLIGVVAFLRGRFRIAIGGGIVVIATTLLSLAVFGWDAHVHWYETAIAPYSGAPLPAFNSQSIASMLSRMERGPGAYWSFDVAPLADVFRIVLYAIYALLLAAFVWAAKPWRSLRADDRAFEGEMMIALTLSLIVSTLAWTHYFALTLLPVAWLWTQLQTHRERWALAAAYVLAAPIVFYGVRMGEGDFGPAFYVLGSHVTVAALIFYALLIRARARLTP